jgi:membrane protease YdiL (CAAX protease family)
LKGIGFIPALAVTATLSTLHHIGHPKSEIWGALLGGVIFASVALVTRSILYPILIHATFGIVNDTFIYLRNYRKKTVA